MKTVEFISFILYFIFYLLLFILYIYLKISLFSFFFSSEGFLTLAPEFHQTKRLTIPVSRRWRPLPSPSALPPYQVDGLHPLWRGFGPTHFVWLEFQSNSLRAPHLRFEGLGLPGGEDGWTEIGEKWRNERARAVGSHTHNNEKGTCFSERRVISVEDGADARKTMTPCVLTPTWENNWSTFPFPALISHFLNLNPCDYVCIDCWWKKIYLCVKRFCRSTDI